MSELIIHRDYPCNPANYKKGRDSAIKYLAIHYVGALGNAEQNARYYHSSIVEASAHYFVGHASEGAAIYSSVPEGDTAWHCGAARYVHPECRNANSIGIEMCCHQDGAGKWYFDRSTVDRTVELAKDIITRHGITMPHVLRHYDVTGKACPRPFVEEPTAWRAFKARLEVDDITEEQVREIAREAARTAVAAAMPQVYTSIPEVPEWARGLVQQAMERGIIRGDGTGKLNLTGQDLKTLSMLDSALRMETK